jgi:cyclophilin family peptidyl-prolyl cis-trans isomerase
MTTPPTQAAPLPAASFLTPRVKLVLLLVALAGVALVAWLILREAKKEERLGLWDQYGKIRIENESEEMYFEDDAPLYQAARDRYVRDLEAFVAKVAAEQPEDALEPLARWRIVRTEGESLIAMKDVLDVAKRLPHTENAVKQLELLQSKFPDFPLNWGQAFAPPGFGSMTKKLLHWFKENAAWEKEHLPKDVAPDAGTTVVFRTTRGDLRLGVYGELAKTATSRFLSDVQRGLYDGTCFVERRQESSGGETRADALRAGDVRSRGAKPFDPKAALAWSESDDVEGVMPDESRNRVLHVRGVVSAWHESGDTYDHPSQLLFVVRTSPGLDYEHTPLGRLLDEASLATLDRIHAGSLWRDDAAIGRDTGEFRTLTDLLREPVEIVKALVYRDGRLVAGDGPTLPSRVAPDESEQTLAGLKADAYRKDPLPVPPAPTDTPKGT